jgi:hypothetical protein
MQAANKANFLQVWHYSLSQRDRTLCSTSRFWKGRNGVCKCFTEGGNSGKEKLLILEATQQREKSPNINDETFDSKHLAGASACPSEKPETITQRDLYAKQGASGHQLDYISILC